MKGLIHLVMLLILGHTGLAQNTEKLEVAAYCESIAMARSYIDSLRDAVGAPGLAIAVSINDQLVWSEGFGYANIEKQEPAHRTTKFRIGSVSKSLTSIGMARLVEDQQLDLDQQVQSYLPDFPEKEYPFTVRQLATHQSGIPHYKATDYFINRHFASVTESLEVFEKRKLKFEPGSDFQYSTFGYVLLSAVMEQASGTPFLEYMDKAIFEPLGVENTIADDVTMAIAERAEFYKVGKDKPVKDFDLSYKWAGGGYLSTAEDLVRIIDGMDELLSEAVIADLWTPVPLRTGEMNPQSYALGWRKYTSKSGLEIIHHGGVAAGGRAFVATLPHENMTIAILANAAVRYGLREVIDITTFFNE